MVINNIVKVYKMPQYNESRNKGDVQCATHALTVTVFPRIEAPGLYEHNCVRPPACIRGPACIQGPASISTFTLRRTDGNIMCISQKQ